MLFLPFLDRVGHVGFVLCSSFLHGCAGSWLLAWAASWGGGRLLLRGGALSFSSHWLLLFRAGALGMRASVVGRTGLVGCPTTCEIVLDQELNLHPALAGRILNRWATGNVLVLYSNDVMS